MKRTAGLFTSKLSGIAKTLSLNSRNISSACTQAIQKPSHRWCNEASSRTIYKRLPCHSIFFPATVISSTFTPRPCEATGSVELKEEIKMAIGDCLVPQKTISVVMATYNGQSYLAEQLDSILAQTLTPDQIVISDDASTDDTKNILLFYQRNHPKIIRVILNDTNVGYIRNFERALKLADGDLIALSDQDDVWLPEKLAEQAKAFSQFANIGLVFSDLKVVNQSLDLIAPSFWQLRRFSGDGLQSENFSLKLFQGSYATGATIMISRSLLNRSFPFSNSVPHDYWLAITGSILFRVYVLSKPLVLYRQHNHNAIGAFPSKRTPLTTFSYQANLKSRLHFLNDLSAWCNENLARNQLESRFIEQLEKIKMYEETLYQYRFHFSKSCLARFKHFVGLMRIQKSIVGKRSVQGLCFDGLIVLSPKVAWFCYSLFQKVSNYSVTYLFIA